MLKPGAPLSGHTFELGTRQLAPGDQAVLLGWTTESQQPARGRARGAVGTMTEAGIALETPDGRLTNLRRMTGTFDAGHAGSPVLGREGRMPGMLVQATDDQSELLVAGLDTIADPLLGPTVMPPGPSSVNGSEPSTHAIGTARAARSRRISRKS